MDAACSAAAYTNPKPALKDMFAILRQQVLEQSAEQRRCWAEYRRAVLALSSHFGLKCTICRRVLAYTLAYTIELQPLQ